MTFFYKLKICFYRFFSTVFGRKILILLSCFIKVKNLRTAGPAKHPFIVAVTIDTESGYVDKNDHRVWQYSYPKAYIGYYKGIENWRFVLDKHKAKATFFLSTNCFSAKEKEKDEIMLQLKSLVKEKHEIGLHLHPDSDLALQETIGRKFDATSSKFYSEDEISLFVKSAKTLIEKNLEITPISFRWGNWALTTKCIAPLEKNGFILDSSATPGIKGHQNDKMAFDWKSVKTHYPWVMSNGDYQDTNSFDSKILQIPIATFCFFGITLRADPSNSELLKACFDHYYKNADRSKKPFVFVVISHSIEGTHKDGSRTKVIDVMDDFLHYARKKPNVKFQTLKESSYFFTAKMK